MKNNNKRYGSALEHGKAHQKDHRNWSRRGFMKNLGLVGGASMLLGKVPVSAVGASPLSTALQGLDHDRVLVLIRLKGGNDGLNTIVPIYDYDRYANLRPTLRLPENNLIGLTDDIGMHQNLIDLQPMWEEDAMQVINSVGYPDQNLSHFRSTDIW
ncbi:MAG: twin-arginine translocation signal domain-containing protein, partial [Bacteroidota bacterium]